MRNALASGRAMGANYSHGCTSGLCLRRAQHPKSRPADDDSTGHRSQHERLTNRSKQELESTHTASHTAIAEPAHVLQVLTDPGACARWAPIEFSTDQAPGECLHVGSRTRLQGRIAGRNVTFEVAVLAADERGLSLSASGPVRLEVDYQLIPSGRGTLIEAQITVGQTAGLIGAIASRSTNAILGAGALRFALRAIAAEAEQLQQAGGHELASAQDRRAA